MSKYLFPASICTNDSININPIWDEIRKKKWIISSNRFTMSLISGKQNLLLARCVLQNLVLEIKFTFDLTLSERTQTLVQQNLHHHSADLFRYFLYCLNMVQGHIYPNPGMVELSSFYPGIVVSRDDGRFTLIEMYRCILFCSWSLCSTIY